MKTIFLAAVFSLAAAAQLFADDTTNVLGDDKSRLSYAIGMMFATRWKEQGVDVDNNMVLRGLNDEQSGGPTLMTPQEMRTIIGKLEQALADKQRELLLKNKTDGEAFLATNRNKPGVMVLPATGMDGKAYELQYEVITDGTGEIPTPADTVTVNYRGTFINGTEFDSSAKAGHPVSFPANRVIPGWSAALTHMKAGSKWQLFIPSDLAYGPTGFPNRIEPNTTLIFDVELLSVQHPQTSVAQPAPPPPLTSDVIKVQGTNIEVLNPDDIRKLQQSETNQAK